MERCLNFISDFKWGIQIIDKTYEERQETKPGNNAQPKKVYEAWVHARGWIMLRGEKIERDCFGSWKAYENQAVSKFSVLQAAVSMATKNFAETFGIASDRKEKESAAISQARKEKKDAIIVEAYENKDVDMDEATDNFSRKPAQK